jgi:hypothetical protein
MPRHAFQYRIGDLLWVVTCVALILGAAQGWLARGLLIAASFGLVLLATLMIAYSGLTWLFHRTGAAAHLAAGVARLPSRARQLYFERRLSRLRPGHSALRVRSLLGSPVRIDGFGDRLYWSYRVAGRRYTISLDPRRLVSTYSNRLSPDRPRVPA